jgi:hypothetical protein
MKWQTLIIDGFERVMELIEPALKGLDKKDLDRQPAPDCNSIGWITWHLTRGQDAQIAGLAGEKQVWIQGDWYSKFNRPPDPEDSGFGHTAEEVAAFKSPDSKTLLDYYRATMVQTKKYIATLNLSDLDRQLNETWYNPPPTVGVRLVSIMADCLQHSGEIAYLRGLIKGKGWLGY